jgi:hypothetical protein
MEWFTFTLLRQSHGQRCRATTSSLQSGYLPFPCDVRRAVRAECGNQVCEYGEQCVDAACNGRGQCSADCPFSAQRCPSDAWRLGDRAVPCSGHGICNLGTGACTCFRGYVGDACKHCDRQFLFFGGSCIPIPGAMVRMVALLVHTAAHHSSGDCTVYTFELLCFAFIASPSETHT